MNPKNEPTPRACDASGEECAMESGQQERELFEATLGIGRDLHRDAKGDYMSAYVQNDWDVWQARAAIPSIAQTGAVADALRMILPMAKGYAAAHPVGSNAAKISDAESVLATLPAAAPGAAIAAREQEVAMGALQAECAGLTSSVATLSALADRHLTSLRRAAAAMKALHETATPDEDSPDLDARIPAHAFRVFVDAHAELLQELAIWKEPAAAHAKSPLEALPPGHLYRAVNNLLCHIGMEGSIDSRHSFVEEAMDALHAIDGGVYLEQIASREESPPASSTEAEGAQQAVSEPKAWINLPCIVKDGEFVGHGEPELSFKRASYGYDWHKAIALYDHPAPSNQAVKTDAAPAVDAGEQSGWLPIADAPKDGVSVLVNDTTSLNVYCMAHYLNCEEWSGWAYDDEQSNDCNPLGPQPTNFMRIGALPTPPASGEAA